jgi:hypothetical protein
VGDAVALRGRARSPYAILQNSTGNPPTVADPDVHEGDEVHAPRPSRPALPAPLALLLQGRLRRVAAAAAAAAPVHVAARASRSPAPCQHYPRLWRPSEQPPHILNGFTLAWIFTSPVAHPAKARWPKARWPMPLPACLLAHPALLPSSSGCTVTDPLPSRLIGRLPSAVAAEPSPAGNHPFSPPSRTAP